MILIGEISAEKQIVINVRVQDDTGVAQDIRAVLNTGFGGYLTLSASAVDVLQLTYIGTVDLLLAGDKPQRLRSYEAVVEWRDAPITVPVLQVEGYPQVGMRLLYGSDLHAHLVDGGFATVAAL